MISFINQFYIYLNTGNTSSFSQPAILSLRHLKTQLMPKKVKPSGKQISMLVVHVIIFAIGSAAMLLLYDKGANGKWVYPWPAWTVAAWALCLVGHFCIVFTSTEDKGYDEYRHQQGYDK